MCWGGEGSKHYPHLLDGSLSLRPLCRPSSLPLPTPPRWPLELAPPLIALNGQHVVVVPGEAAVVLERGEAGLGAGVLRFLHPRAGGLR